MAIAEAGVLAANNISGTSVSTGTFLPVSGQLYIATIAARSSTGADEPASLSHSSFSAWTKIGTHSDGTNRRISKYWAICDQAPATEALVIDYGAENQAAVIVRIRTYTGFNAASPIAQFKTATGNGTAVTVSFDVASTAGNYVEAATAFASDSGTFVWDLNMAAIGNTTSGNSSGLRMYIAGVNGQEDSPSGTISSSFLWTIIAVEIAVAAGGAVVGESTSQRATRRRRR